MATTSYSNWDFSNYHVQQELEAGQFISAETTLVAAGLPSLDASSQPGLAAAGANQTVYPIGLLEQVSVQQSKQLQRIFEIGSTRSYFIPGRVIGSLSLGRTFFFGPSLLRALYAYYKNTGSGYQIGTAGAGETVTLDDGITQVEHPNRQLLNNDFDDKRKIWRQPGADYFYIDLASDMFAQPTGLAIYFKDYRHNSVGAMYLENCYVQGHQMSVSSGSVLIMEGASLQYDRIRPIEVLNG